MQNYTFQSLDSEFTDLLNSHADHHDKMRNMVSFYQTSAFYSQKAGDPKPNSQLGVNLIKAFADKNINYTCKFPTIKVPHKGTDPQVREQCSLIEKVLYATHENNNTEQKQNEWAFDATVKSEAVAVTTFVLKAREVKIRRYDPQYCYFKFANQNDRTLQAFFVAIPMTADQIEAQFGVRPTSSNIPAVQVTLDGNSVPVDGVNRYFVVYRWDDKVFCAWAGNTWLQQPYNHGYGFIPVDSCQPFEAQDLTQRGFYFLDPLLPLQAEYNDIFRRRSAFVKKSGKPTLWGRGIMANQWDEVKKAAKGEGGAIGLKANGELGFLTPPNTDLFDTHLDRLFEQMKNIAGFPSATFGEMVGANTSGNALSMYFQPTTQSIERQWIAWKQFYQGINEKVLRLYETFLRADEQLELYGHMPKGSFEYLEQTDENGQKYYRRKYQSGGYSVTFNKSTIDGYYRSIILPPKPTPQDEVAYKTLLIQAAANNLLARTTIYEEWGIVDPEDELDLLAAEREDPRLHPEVLAQATSALNGLNQPQPGSGQLLPGGNPSPDALANMAFTQNAG